MLLTTNAQTTKPLETPKCQIAWNAKTFHMGVILYDLYLLELHAYYKELRFQVYNMFESLSVKELGLWQTGNVTSAEGTNGTGMEPNSPNLSSFS